MVPKFNDMLYGDRAFVWIAMATGLTLLMPLIAMQFSNEVNWSRVDFFVMGFLLFSSGSLFVLVSRRLSQKRRLVVGVGFTLTFLYVWAELAVGIFTNLGS